MPPVWLSQANVATFPLRGRSSNSVFLERLAMEYFKIDWHIRDDESDRLVDIDVIPATEVPWTLGLTWAPGMTVPDPIEFIVDENSGTELPDAFMVGIPLFSSCLLKALNKAGVDNLDLHNAAIVDPRTGKTDFTYKAVNILGAIRCADLAKSEYDSTFTAPGMEFKRLVIDLAQAKNIPFFRLAENTDFILAREDVATILKAADLKGIRVISLNDPMAY